MMKLQTTASGPSLAKRIEGLAQCLPLPKKMIESGYGFCSLRKQPNFRDATTGFPPNDVWETGAEIPYCDDHFFIFISFPLFIYDLFHISLTLISFTGTYEPTIDLLPTSVAS